MKKKIDSLDITIYALLTIYAICCLYPLWYIIVVSFSSFKGYYADSYHIIPKSFSLENYSRIITDGTVIHGFLVSMKITIIGAVISLYLTITGGYVLSKQHLPGMKKIFKIVLFTMYFSGGLIPSYLLITGLGLKNSIWALILPGCVSTYYLIIARSYFTTLPAELEEAARIDGANDLTIIFRIIIPISKPMIAALTLFYSVDYWNGYLGAVFYIDKVDIMPVQLVIRNLLIGFQFKMNAPGIGEVINTAGMNMAAVIVGLLPILVIYPFLQKYFAAGVLIGAVKE